MFDFEVGDLVEVKQDSDLNPVLRFYYNKKAIITEILNGVHNSRYIIIFENGKTFLAHKFELTLKAKANKNGKTE